MTSESSNYIIGFNDGARGVQGLFSQVYQNDPSYLRGVQLGAAQSTLKAVRASQLAGQQAAQAGLQAAQATERGFSQLSELVRHGQNAILGAIDDTNQLLSEQIAMERIKNALVDIEPYLVKRLASDDTRPSGKQAVLLRAEREIYAELASNIGSLYERIGRVPQLAPGCQALIKVVESYDNALSAMSAELMATERAANNAMEAAAHSLLKAGVSPLVIGIALDIAVVEFDSTAPMQTVLERVKPPYAPAKLLTFWELDGRWKKQGAKTRLERTKKSAPLFASWAAEPKSAPAELKLLRDALIQHEVLSGEIAVAGRRPATPTNCDVGHSSFLMTLINKNVKTYCNAVASMAAKQTEKFSAVTQKQMPPPLKPKVEPTAFHKDLSEFISALDTLLSSKPSSMLSMDVASLGRRTTKGTPSTDVLVRSGYNKVIQHVEGQKVVRLLGPNARNTISQLQLVPFLSSSWFLFISWAPLPSLFAFCSLFDASFWAYGIVAGVCCIWMVILLALRKKAKRAVGKVRASMAPLRELALSSS